MNVLKIIGWLALGTIVLGAAVGGVVLWQRKQAKPGPTPSNPPRKPSDANDTTP